jgi:hypothetical protein
MKDLTLVQTMIAGLITAYAITVRKTNVAVLSTLAFSLAMLHAYDHLYRVKRGKEKFLITL